jgi:hypothetical protein
MYKKWLIALLLSAGADLAQGQPVPAWSVASDGRPVGLFLRDRLPLMVSSKGAFLFDLSGNLTASDSAFTVDAAALDQQGNLIVVGVLDSNGVSQPYVRMLDTSLQQKWIALLAQTSNYIAHPEAVTTDNHGRIYVSGPATDPTASPASVEFFSGLDSLGSPLWSFVFAVGFDDQRFKKLKSDFYGNAVIGTEVGLSGPSNGEMHFRKYDSNGLFLQENLFDPIFAHDVLEDFGFTPDGKTLLTGPFNLSGQAGNSISALVYFDSTGLFSNYSAYDGFGFDELNRLLTDDHGQAYVIVSGTDLLVTGESRFDLFKFGSAGNTLWNRRHRDAVVTYQKAHAFSSYGEKILIAGENRIDTTSQYEGLVVAYDTSGNFLYELTEPATGELVFKQIVPVDDSVFYVMGELRSAGTPASSVLYRYAVSTTSVAEWSPSENLCSLYPSPASRTVHLNGECRSCLVTVFDVEGRAVLKDDVAEDGFSVEGLPSGCYVVWLAGDGRSQRLRLLVE